jgi:dTDP-4-amino-4,6-dideoxygalactose transaminase
MDPHGRFLESASNHRLSDLQAAVGRVQLSRLPVQLVERRAQVEQYRAHLSALPVDFPVEPPGRLSNWQSLCVRLPTQIDAQGVVDALAQDGIGARRGVQNAHEQPAYADPRSHRVVGALTESERAARHGLCLPLFPGLAEADIARVAASLRAAIERPR